MASKHTAEFWQNCERYHDLAEEYVEAIEIKSPDRITCRISHLSNCGFCGTTVKYYEYTGNAI